MEPITLHYPRPIPYAYVRNNPLAFVDPSGFTEAEAWRLWRVEETPGQLGIRVTFDKLTPPEARPVAPLADAGANAPTNDTGTMGTGTNASPQEVPGAEPAPSHPGLWQGIGDGVVETIEQLPAMVPGSHENTIAQLTTVVEMIDAYKKGDAIDAVNVINPLMPVASFGFAIDEGDWYTVGRTSVGIGVAIVGMVVARKMGGGGRTTRGPPGIGGIVEKTPSGKRVGDFTRSQKLAAKAENAVVNGGTMACTECGRTLENIRSEKGMPTPTNQAQLHHDPPIVEGGGRHSTPVVLCPECHAGRHLK